MPCQHMQTMDRTARTADLLHAAGVAAPVHTIGVGTLYGALWKSLGYFLVHTLRRTTSTMQGTSLRSAPQAPWTMWFRTAAHCFALQGAAVLKHMIRGPRGALQRSAPGMLNERGRNVCSKKLPNDFQERTVEGANAYPAGVATPRQGRTWQALPFNNACTCRIPPGRRPPAAARPWHPAHGSSQREGQRGLTTRVTFLHSSPQYAHSRGAPCARPAWRWWRPGAAPSARRQTAGTPAPAPGWRSRRRASWRPRCRGPPACT